MSEIEELCGKFKKWKQIQSKKINAQKISEEEPEEEVNCLLDAITIFHKEINKSDKELIDEGWFTHVQKAKKHLKNLQQIYKKKKEVKPPKLIKSNSNIEYPDQLLQDKKEQEKAYARMLYKPFLLNLPENVLEKKQLLVDFINKIIDGIYEDLKIEKEKNWVPEDKARACLIRVQKIAQGFQKSQATLAKQDMLEGIIDYKEVSKLNPQAFISEKTRIAEQKRVQALAKENQTGFYDQMKKNINKNASEQCRFCQKKEAYCEGQKQIRAADQPMTRFMVCNACGKRWRQE